MAIANTHSKWVGGALVFWQGHRARWVDAVGTSVTKFELVRGLPMVGAAGADTYWGTMTNVESGAGSTEIAATNTAGVAARITTAGNEYDGANIQASGAAITMAANKPFYFGAKIAINHATSTDLFVGLCQTRTIILAKSTAHGLHASTKSHIGFYKLDAGTATKYAAEKAGALTSSSASTMDTSAHIYEVNFDGSSADFYVDGTNVGTVALANCPTANPLRPSLCFRNGNGAVRQCDIYWMKAIQIGY